MLRRRWPIFAFVGWTAYVWTTRIVNAWTVSDEATGAKVVSTVIAAGLLVAAVVGAAILVTARRRRFSSGETSFFVWFARATFVIWALRIVQILADGSRDVPFKVVHVVLGVISVVLAYATLGRVRSDAGTDRSAPAGEPVSPGAKADR